MISKDQIRAARALLGWSQSKLAGSSGFTTPSIANIELGKQNPTADTLQIIQHTLESAGVEFVDQEGVRKKKSVIQSYHGKDGFRRFMKDVDRVAMYNNGAEFLVNNVDERLFLKFQDKKDTDDHEKIIVQSGVTYRILVKEGDDFTPAESYAQYRGVSKDMFQPVPFYIYGDNVAVISFKSDDVDVFVTQHKDIAELYRKQFDAVWNVSGDMV